MERAQSCAFRFPKARAGRYTQFLASRCRTATPHPTHPITQTTNSHLYPSNGSLNPIAGTGSVYTHSGVAE